MSLDSVSNGLTNLKLAELINLGGLVDVFKCFSLLQTLNSAHLKDEKLAGVQIDLEGAFENCSRVYLKDLLELMGLGPTFLRWVDCLWVGLSGRISYGGIEQEPIEMTGGLTQGAPESAVLFNLANIPLKDPSKDIQ